VRTLFPNAHCANPNPESEDSLNNSEDTLSVVRDWLSEIEQDEIDDPTYRALRRAVRAYSADLEYRAGMGQPYSSVLNRRHELCELMHSLDPCFDFAAELAGEHSVVPDEIRPMYEFLVSIALDIGAAIHAIEAQYPQWAEAFAIERRLYSNWQQGIGPLAGEPWCADA
jgi:hypothetical protein